MAAGASATPLSKSLAADLLPSSYVKKTGFSKVVLKPTVTSKTGLKSCPNAAQETFKSVSDATGLLSEVVDCTSTEAAAALLNNARSGSSATLAVPPKRLGSSAFERSRGGSTYFIYWQRGKIVEVVGLYTSVPASNSSSTSTTLAQPITPAQQMVLSRAAAAQDALLR